MLRRHQRFTQMSPAAQGTTSVWTWNRYDFKDDLDKK